MTQVLQLSMRPKTFSTMIGAERLVDKLRKRIASNRDTPAWMFTGQLGSGKTTIARIMAIALQCTHQELFGDPCIACRRAKSSFDIMEINAADISTKEELTSALSGYNRYPRPNSQRRVYILDEAQKTSTHSQSLMLKMLEDCPATTVFIICTTEPDKILGTLSSRCAVYDVPSFGIKETKALIKQALKKVGSDQDSQELAEALLDAQVNSPRLILGAVEKYLAGSSATEAAKVGVAGSVDIYNLSRSVVTGDWQGAARWLMSANPEDVKGIQGAVIAYLHGILMGEKETSDKGKIVADGITSLVSLTNYISGKAQLSGIAAVLYRVTQSFKNNRR